MNRLPCILMFVSLALVELPGAARAKGNEPNILGLPANSKSKQSPKNEDYLINDDEDLIGSGNGELKFDHESNGSGDGPIDETVRHTTSSHLDEIDTKIKERKLIPSTVTEPETTIPTVPITDKTLNNPTQITSLSTSETIATSTATNSTYTDSVKTTTDDNKMDNNVDIYGGNSGRQRIGLFKPQTAILTAVLIGAVVGLLGAILVVMFLVYRVRKKDEGSYALDEMERFPPLMVPYDKNNQREFFA